MKIRTGFVSNSSSSSFLIYDPTLTIDQVKTEVERIAEEHAVDNRHYEYHVIDEEYICHIADYMSECDGILENGEYGKTYEKLNKLRNNGTLTGKEFHEKLMEYWNGIDERNKAAIKEWTKTPKFQNEIKGRIHIIGGENDPFIYETLVEEMDFDFKGEHLHLG